MNKQCLYCVRTGKLRVHKDEAPELESNIYICDACWRLLQNPTTALPLIRGHLSLTAGREMPSGKFKKMIDPYIEMLAKLKPSN